MKYSSLFPIAVLLLAMIAFTLSFAPLDRNTGLDPVEAQDTTLQDPTARVEPAESVVGVGDTFTVVVMIDHASDLGGFEFDLLFITTTVRVDSVVLGDFPSSTGRNVISLGPTIDNQAGKVAFGAASFGSAATPNGTGTLAVITLTAQGEGESSLNLQSVLMVNTAKPPSSQVVTDEDGTVVVGTAPTATSTPTATPTTTGAATATPTATSTATATGTPPTPTSTATATTAPEPVIVVYPTEASVGETFTFTGSHFTPDGEIEEWFADPDGVRHRFDPRSFHADSSGGFSRQHSWEKYWPVGTYSYIAKDVAKGSETSVWFEMTEALPTTATSTTTPTATATPTATHTPTPTPTATPYRLYLPLVLRAW